MAGKTLPTGGGIASIGGILASGVLTLLVLPILQSLVTPRDRITAPAGS